MTKLKNKSTDLKHPVELLCTQEGCEYKTGKSLHAKQELGRHLRFVHGIAGQTSSAKAEQQREQQMKHYDIADINTNNSASDNEAAQSTEIVARRKYQKKTGIASISGGALSNGEAIALITVGRIQAYCEAEAEKFGISKSSFTERCAQLFFATQIRK